MRYAKTRTDEERFMEKVSPEPNSGCWLWTAGTDAEGYGRFTTGTHGNQRHYRAHRWIVSAPEDSVVMHRCDNPTCVNPAHLRLGTQTENRADCVRKSRHAKGDRHGSWKDGRWASRA